MGCASYCRLAVLGWIPKRYHQQQWPVSNEQRHLPYHLQKEPLTDAKQKDQPPFWAGFKFFNVYGPNEFHKGRMASVIFHAVQQINETGEISGIIMPFKDEVTYHDLLKSNHIGCLTAILDLKLIGEKKYIVREFIYVL